MTSDAATNPATPEKTETPPAKPLNPTAIKKAIAAGKEMAKQPEATKADIARKMFETISDEPREIIVQAFVDGAGLTPKGAQTYFYNCKRKAAKKSA